MLRDQLPWIVVAAVVLAGIVAAVLLGRTAPVSFVGHRLRRRRPHRDHFRQGEEREAPVRHAAIVVNPSKVADPDSVRAQITTLCHAEGWGDPMFFETTVADRGERQARQAVADGADVVCSLGGDGTVSAVAAALIGTETPLGILPAGTGNLLARNLDLPVGSLAVAVRTALTGRNRRIDVGEVVIGPVGAEPGGEDRSRAATAATETAEPVGAAASPAPRRYPFLVMTGIGMDAAIMQGTDPNLKATVGWGAYVLSGLKHLVSPEFRASFRIDDEPAFRRRARAVIIGNCGRLLGGLVLMPDARVDDRQLDVIIASPRGLVGWAPVIARALTRRRKGHPTLDHRICQQIQVRTDRPLPVQIDGDVIAETTEVTAVVRSAALTVRVPHA